jgi:transcription elongation factor SPT5
MNLMRKYLNYENTSHPLRISAVIARTSLKGYIYVEARSMGDVQAALDKMHNVYASKITLIPLEEMVDVLTIRKREAMLKPGSWVRTARGKYKGDLAQVTQLGTSFNVN